jgi:hypothetical protein
MRKRLRKFCALCKDFSNPKITPTCWSVLAIQMMLPFGAWMTSVRWW